MNNRARQHEESGTVFKDVAAEDLSNVGIKSVADNVTEVAAVLEGSAPLILHVLSNFKNMEILKRFTTSFHRA